MNLAVLFAAVLAGAGSGLVEVEYECGSDAVDPAGSVILAVRARYPREAAAPAVDLRDRLRGFTLADVDEGAEPVDAGDGRLERTVWWKLLPVPAAEEYRIAPVAVECAGEAFIVGAVRFKPPAVLPAAAGPVEADAEEDFIFRWRYLLWAALALAVASALVAAAVFAVRALVRQAKLRAMSPVERAWTELAALVRRRLPEKGRYKDFYVELTLVVRRYVQRRFGIRAPHLTTPEFLRAAAEAGERAGAIAPPEAREFLESADLVKFAGVEATENGAAAAVESARRYIKAAELAAGGEK